MMLYIAELEKLRPNLRHKTREHPLPKADPEPNPFLRAFNTEIIDVPIDGRDQFWSAAAA